MTKKSTHWVTIPEETIHTPASKPSRKSGGMSGKSKLFWGAGFIVLVIVTVALLAPQQMANILQGNLFEQAGFQPLEVIPEEEPVEEPVEEPMVEEPVAEPEDITVVEAETEAVSIQIEPVAVEKPAEELVTEELVEEPITEEPVTIQEELDANRQLLEQLTQQIQEFKEKDEQKTEIIEDLAGLVEDQINGTVHPSATTTLPPALTTTTTIGEMPTGYRINTHTVQITPHQMLQQNTAQLQAQQIAVADITAEDYRAQLAQAEGTPDTGPKEALLLTLALVFVALLGWKIARFARV